MYDVAGVIIFKDFETGSYQNMRITMYYGTGFDDIKKSDEFSSCTVGAERGYVHYDFVSSGHAPVCGMPQLLDIAKNAREYLWQNPYVTIAEFCCVNGDTKFRPSSYKCGVHEPVSFCDLFNCDVNDIYMLCSDNHDKAYVFNSLLCDVLNFALGRLYNTEESFFGLSGGGIYVNLGLLSHSRKALDAIGVPDNIRRLIKTDRHKSRIPKLNTPLREAVASQSSPSVNSHRNIIHLLCCLKCRVYEYISGIVPDDCISAAKFVMALPCDEKINSLVNICCRDFRDFACNFQYMFKVKSHVDYLTPAEILCLASVRDRDIAEKAFARSTNEKLLSRLPCPPYYDSRGKAYWQ